MTPLERRIRAAGRRGGFADFDEDPAAGLVNLFDIWMVFAIAVLLVLVAEMQKTDALALALDDARALPDRMRPSGHELQGRGTRLGTAYRLPNGEVVYVPDAAAGPPSPARQSSAPPSPALPSSAGGARPPILSPSSLPGEHK